MEWSALFNLIDPKLLIVVAVCWVCGYVFKQTPMIPDWLIVYCVTIVGVAAVFGLQGASVTSTIQGILCGAFAVYGNQIVKQSKEAADTDAK